MYTYMYTYMYSCVCVCVCVCVCRCVLCRWREWTCQCGIHSSKCPRLKMKIYIPVYTYMYVYVCVCVCVCLCVCMGQVEKVDMKLRYAFVYMPSLKDADYAVKQVKADEKVPMSQTHTCTCTNMPFHTLTSWFNEMCSMTCSCVWHDSFACVCMCATWLMPYSWSLQTHSIAFHACQLSMHTIMYIYMYTYISLYIYVHPHIHIYVCV